MSGENVLNSFAQPGRDGDNVANFAGTVNLTGSTTSSNRLITTKNIGTAGTGVTAVHYGDGVKNTAVLTLSSTLPAIAGGAALGVGKLVYTLPTGAVIVTSAYMSVGITQTEAHINADTPTVGLGTVVASGAISVLSGTATFQSIVVGTAAANCTGTATVKTATPTAAVPLVIETAGAKTVYFNAAATWAASGDAAAIIAGTIIINYTFVA